MIVSTGLSEYPAMVRSIMAVTDDKLHTYTTPRLRHMLSAQQDSRDWKLADLALVVQLIGELEREIACREQVGIPERY